MKYSRKILSITAIIIAIIYFSDGYASKITPGTLNDLTIKEFSSGLSNRGAPASVCACAYIGVLANSLSILTLNCSINASNNKKLNSAIRKCKHLQSDFYSLMNKDCEDFNKSMKYWKYSTLQKSIEGQRSIVNSTLTPIDIMQKAYETLNTIGSVSKMVKPEILCDLKIAAYYCQAAFLGAKAAAESNLSLIIDTKEKGKLQKRIYNIYNNFSTVFPKIITNLGV